MPEPTTEQIDALIQRWERSGAAERANYVLFLTELCDLLDIPRPDPAGPDNSTNLYCFERAVVRRNPDGTTSIGYIDLYKSTCLLLEAKQGTLADLPVPPLSLPAAGNGLTKTGHGKRGTLAFDKALERAYHQARGYITALPAGEGRPPFLIVCDVGHSLDLYAEFTCTGGQYERFPDPVSYRITLPDLHRPEIRERLRKVWLDPHSLDPSKVAAKVTRDIAGRLAVLAKSLEADGHDPQIIAGFLQRCLFTMFAEDVGLLPEDGFKSLLERVKGDPRGFPVLISALWKEMATGTHYSALLLKEIAHFNGGLFETTTALPLSAAQLDLLADAAATDWSGVEPSVFGTLLVRALDPHERHKLGAEFTPRSYVERLIRPTIIDPLREQWTAVRIAAANLHEEAEKADSQADQLDAEAKAKLAAGASAGAKQLGAEAVRLRKEAQRKDAEALAQVVAFHHYLCDLTILDPACGTANFLYVTMEHMKRLEAEVLETIAALGGDLGMEMQGFRVRPEHFIGLEINQQAVAIAQLVLWIGYFQWQHRTTGKADPGDRPLLPKDRSIFEQDAVLAYDERIPRRDPVTGQILTIWDGHTTKLHPVTGKPVPDESARTVLFDYVTPRRAEWPKADYIVGNPPFIGASRMREALGDGYTEALRKTWKGDVPESADFVMFWWCKAAELVRDGKAKRFGFITTNSIHQTFNRRVLEPFLGEPKKPLHLAYAIPDHPWIDSADGAAVRIAMTVAAPGKGEGSLEMVISEEGSEDGEVAVMLQSNRGTIAANLQVGADVSSCGALKANLGISNRGIAFLGTGFVIDEKQANLFRQTLMPEYGEIIRPIRNGKDLTSIPRNEYGIDLLGWKIEDVQRSLPELYQWLLTTVKPERDQSKRASYRERWWIFGEPRASFRPALKNLGRYLATVMTGSHRWFAFLPEEILPDQGLIAVALNGGEFCAILNSTPHALWSLAAGGRMGLGNDPRYNNSRCFDTFPFPCLSDSALVDRLRDLGERLDAHRKRQQELHSDLTLTGMYNVLEKLRTGETLTAKEKDIHDKGLVSVLKQIHDDLDAAVFEAYGWTDLHKAITLLEDFQIYDWETDTTAMLEADPESFAQAIAEQRERIEQELLTRLVALNHERAAEEKRGLIRWLRPEFQNPQECATGVPVPRHSPEGDAGPVDSGEHRQAFGELSRADAGGTLQQASQDELLLPPSSFRRRPSGYGGQVIPQPSSFLPWPDEAPAQVAAVRKLLPVVGKDPEAVSACFGRKSKKRTDQIAAIIATLESLGYV
jgi:hypothetical protein